MIAVYEVCLFYFAFIKAKIANMSYVYYYESLGSAFFINIQMTKIYGSTPSNVHVAYNKQK